MNSPAQREQYVKKGLIEFITEVQQGLFIADEELQSQIEILFNAKAWGFREVVLVVAVATWLDPAFDASVNFYSCHPRPLYEKAIHQVLDLYAIPCRQSGPLNVAKGAEALNQQWAARREPQAVANQVVLFVQLIKDMDEQALHNFIKLLLYRFLQEAVIVQNSYVQLATNVDIEYLYMICKTLIEKTPDAGNTPQRIIGYLLSTYHELFETNISVFGYLSHASTASTTSNKIGDITEINSKNMLIIYEVTVKKFNDQRIREAYNAIKAYQQKYTFQFLEPIEILVLCRKNDAPVFEHSPQTSIYLGKVLYRDTLFHFIDIYEWIMAQLLRMNEPMRVAFFNQLQAYIGHKNTSRAVKEVWGEFYHL